MGYTRKPLQMLKGYRLDTTALKLCMEQDPGRDRGTHYHEVAVKAIGSLGEKPIFTAAYEKDRAYSKFCGKVEVWYMKAARREIEMYAEHCVYETGDSFMPDTSVVVNWIARDLARTEFSGLPMKVKEREKAVKARLRETLGNDRQRILSEYRSIVDGKGTSLRMDGIQTELGLF